MTDEEFKQKIKAEIARTEQIIGDYEEMTQPVSPDDAIGRVSRMDAINNKSVAEAALRQSKDKLSKLKHALSKIGSPDFGVCMRCKSPIPLGRILLKPESAFCVNCAR